MLAGTGGLALRLRGQLGGGQEARSFAVTGRAWQKKKYAAIGCSLLSVLGHGLLYAPWLGQRLSGRLERYTKQSCENCLSSDPPSLN